MAAANQEYSASNLTVLEGLDAVRKRPGMYIGSTDSRGLQHTAWEIIDNSVDEAIAGHCNRIDVTLHDDGSISVQDNGRGIPVDVEPKTGLTGVEVVFTKLHAGGKFGGGSYGASGGLHGVGASVVNALSSRLTVEVHRGGQRHIMDFKTGVAGQFDAAGTFTPSAGLRHEAATQEGTGTFVRYWPDRSIFLKDATISVEAMHARAKQTAFLVPGLEINVTDARTGTPATETYKYDGGIEDFVESLPSGGPVTPVLVARGEGDYVESVPVLDDAGQLQTQEVTRQMGVEVALRWNTDFDTDLRSFVNIVSTPKGGTHVQGFERALVRAVNDALKSQRILKTNEEPVTKEDVLEGLTAIVTVRIAEPQFEGQTKEILGTAAANKIVSDVVLEALKGAFNDKKRKQDWRRGLDKIATAARTRRDLRARKETIRRKNALESSSLPAKLADCRSNEMEETELFIVEGDSAMGTAKAGRDAENQALLPIRGKILNVMKAKEKDMLANKECAAIITSLGAGSGQTFDMESLRYGKLILMTDADVDGAHIRTLLLALCYRYMRPLLMAGRVYAAMPPLHKLEIKGGGKGKEVIYTYTPEEMTAEVAKLEKRGKSVTPVRFKGLGEMNAPELSSTTMARATRKLRQITVDDAAAAAAVFELLMGQEVEPRRDFIVANRDLLHDDQIDA